MTIAFAAIHRTLHYRGEDTGLYVATFSDSTTFFSRRRPKLYDAAAQPIASREVLPGTCVNVSFHEHRGRKFLEAIQLVRDPPEEDSPFRLILDDGHL